MGANAFLNTNTVQPTAKDLIEYAFRECGKVAEAQTPQYIDAAILALHHILQDLSNKNLLLFLWKYIVFGGRANTRQYVLPEGVVDIMQFNWRNPTIPQVSTPLPTDNATAPNAFANNNGIFNGNLFVATVAENWIGADYGLLGTGAPNLIRPTFVGVNTAINYTFTPVLEYSVDGSTWNIQQSLSAQTLNVGEWMYWQLDGVNPQRYWRIRETVNPLPMQLNQAMFAFSNYTIPMYRLNRTDYWDLPNKDYNYGVRPLQYWYDRQIPAPIINFWGVLPDDLQIWEALVQVQMPEIKFETVIPMPQRWMHYVQSGLSAKLALQLPDIDPNRIVLLQQNANTAYAFASSEERDKSPFFLKPNVTYYTQI